MLVQLLVHSCVFNLLLQVMPVSFLRLNFQADSVGSVPPGWETRGPIPPQPVYKVEAESAGSRYLAARSAGTDVQLGIEVTAQPEYTRSLSWRWRVWELPRGADERNSKTMDSAASVYAVFGSRLFPRILKYVWSTSVPAGSLFKHPRSGRVAIMVVNSGSDSIGQWRHVRRNLVEDYQRAFGGKPGNLIALGVKTDSDSTRSSARADYDDFQLSKE